MYTIHFHSGSLNVPFIMFFLNTVNYPLFFPLKYLNHPLGLTLSTPSLVYHYQCNLSGTAHFFFAAYVILFSIVIMNLLIGLAVSDISALMQNAKRGSIICQIDMIHDMMDMRATAIYRNCVPSILKKLFDG